MSLSLTNIILTCLIHIPSSTNDVLFTTSYGTPAGDTYEALNQGRINGITSWGIQDKRLTINAWSADYQTKFDQYGSAYTDNDCVPFTLASTDYITGYKIYVEHDDSGDTVRGLRFYTRNSNSYSCIGTYFVPAYAYSYIFNQNQFYYLTGWKIRSASTIDQMQLQFTQISLIASTTTPINLPSASSEISAKPTSNPITISPTSNPTNMPSFIPTGKPTTNPITISPTKNPTNMPSISSIIPTVNPTSKPTTNPTIQPSEFPTEQPTANPSVSPTLEPTIIPTMNPNTMNPTHAPFDDLDIIIEVTESDNEVTKSIIPMKSTETRNILPVNNSESVNSVWGDIGMFVIVTILSLIWMACIILSIIIIYIKHNQKQLKEIKIANETQDIEGHMDYDVQLQIALDAIDTIGGPGTNTNTIGFISDKSDNSKTNSDDMLFKKLPESEPDDETDDDESDDGMYEPGSTANISIKTKSIINIPQIKPIDNDSQFGYINPNTVAELLCFQQQTNEQFVD